MFRRPPPPFYQFVANQPPVTPGAMNMGFESEMLAYRPAIGPGIAARFQFASIGGTPQSYQAASMAWLAGVAGIVHGQSVLQPLSNPYAGT